MLLLIISMIANLGGAGCSDYSHNCPDCIANNCVFVFLSNSSTECQTPSARRTLTEVAQAQCPNIGSADSGDGQNTTAIVLILCLGGSVLLGLFLVIFFRSRTKKMQKERVVIETKREPEKRLPDSRYEGTSAGDPDAHLGRTSSPDVHRSARGRTTSIDVRQPTRGRTMSPDRHRRPRRASTSRPHPSKRGPSQSYRRHLKTASQGPIPSRFPHAAGGSYIPDLRHGPIIEHHSQYSLPPFAIQERFYHYSGSSWGLYNTPRNGEPSHTFGYGPNSYESHTIPWGMPINMQNSYQSHTIPLTPVTPIRSEPDTYTQKSSSIESVY